MRTYTPLRLISVVKPYFLFYCKCSKAKVHDKKFVQDACCTPNETGSLTHHKQ
jgi:hypothetical protein